jgi:hypothetical protein
MIVTVRIYVEMPIATAIGMDGDCPSVKEGLLSLVPGRHIQTAIDKPSKML